MFFFCKAKLVEFSKILRCEYETKAYSSHDFFLGV